MQRWHSPLVCWRFPTLQATASGDQSSLVLPSFCLVLLHIIPCLLALPHKRKEPDARATRWVHPRVCTRSRHTSSTSDQSTAGTPQGPVSRTLVFPSTCFLYTTKSASFLLQAHLKQEPHLASQRTLSTMPIARALRTLHAFPSRGFNKIKVKRRCIDNTLRHPVSHPHTNTTSLQNPVFHPES